MSRKGKKSWSRLDESRRTFLKRSLAATVGLSAMSAGMLGGLALATGRKRRHLINIIAQGGWDGSWFHTPIPADRMQRFTNDPNFRDKIHLSETLNGTSHLSADIAKPFKLTKRFDETRNGFYHPKSGGRHLLGTGWKNVFKTSDLDDILIWKGLAQEGQHIVGNEVILQGSNSPYNLSFSAIVAKQLAEQDYLRPLHYVMIADKPRELFTFANMNTGAAIPICVGSLAQFHAITRIDPNDIVDTGLKSMINDVVRKLAIPMLQSRAILKSSQDAAASFSNSFLGATQISGSELAKSPEFRFFYKKYFLGMASSLLGLYNFSDLNPELSLRDKLGEQFLEPDGYWGLKGFLDSVLSTRYGADVIGPLPDLTAYRNAKIASAADPANPALKVQLSVIAEALSPMLDDILSCPDGSFRKWIKLLREAAFPYAMADFLVRNDLAAVVDIPTPVGDFHGENLMGLAVATISFSGFQQLMTSLREVEIAQGGSLLDATLMVMHTELDREPFLLDTIEGGFERVGTNHGYSTSAIFAGYGIKGGTVVGDLHSGPDDGTRFDSPQLGELMSMDNGIYAHPLPIDPTASSSVLKPLSQGGRVMSVKAILPTVIAAMGLTVPSDQISEYTAVPAVLKRGQ